MGLLKQLVITVLVIGVSSSVTEKPSQTNVSSTPTPVPFSTPVPLTSSSTTEPPAEVEELSEDLVLASASIRQVETPAVVEEVSYNWSDGVSPDEGDYAGEATVYETDEYGGHHGYPEYPEDYYYDEGHAYEDYEQHAANDTEVPVHEDFQDNVPESLHNDKDIIINRDNLIPIMKTLILAVTGKENPTYPELLKAGGITAFKTSLKHLGDEKLGVDLLALAKKLTNMLDDSENSEVDEKDDILSKMAEDFLAFHRFKLVLPESMLLHEAELKELLAKRMEESEEKGRSSTPDESQLTIFMPRSEPGVTTLLSLSPVPWIALLTGLVSIPYFLSGDSPSPVARADRPSRLPYRQLRPPGLPPFIRQQQLRRDETNLPSRNQPVDQEFLEYKKKYAQWYNQWYLKHKEYYDKNYPFNLQGHGQVRPPPAIPAQRPPLKPVGAAAGPNNLHRKPRPPPQRRRKPPQNPQLPPQPRLPLKRPRVRPGPPISQQNLRPPALPQKEGARNAGHSSISTISEPPPSTFGTFQKEDNHGDSHFRVFHSQDIAASTTVPSTPKVPSPQPVYIPTTKAIPTTETGFKPIIKPDATVSDDAGAVRAQTVSESVLIPKQVKPNFRPPKQEDLLAKTKPTPVPKKKPGTVSTTLQLAPGGFRPIHGPQSVSSPKTEPETTTRKVSAVTSSIFKTSPTTPVPPFTSPAAIFFRTAREKITRVVTSSSVVIPPTSPIPLKQPLQDVKWSQSNQEPRSPPQNLDPTESLQAEESKPTVIVEAVPAGPQFLRSHQQAPVAPSGPSALGRGVVRTNVPTTIRVVDHRDHRPPQGFGLGPKPREASDPSLTISTPTTASPGPSITTTVPIFALDPFYGSRLSRIDVIFDQLKVEGEGCREQVVCNIYKNPEVFTPFSDFLSRQLTVTLQELRRPKVSDERILRFFRYLKAARDGQDGADCLTRYHECAQDTTTLSHRPIISTYQKVSRLMDASSSS